VNRRTLPLLLAAALVATGCNSHLGRTVPGCNTVDINSATILMAQTVRGAEYNPCINELQPGWGYEHLESRSGQTRFWLSSDRVGDRFLEITFEGSCDLSSAVETSSDEPGIPLYVEEIEADFHIRITVIPEGDNQNYRAYAAEVAQEIGSSRVANRLVRARIDLSDLPTAERIRLALRDGQAVLIVGAREYEEGTVELHILRPGGENPSVLPGMSAAEAVEEVADPLDDPVYRALWYYPFENGCVTYRFDAKGAGADRISYEVKDALGFLLLAPLREYGEQVGYLIP